MTLHQWPKKRNVCVQVVMSGCVCQIALPSDPGTSYASLKSPSYLLMTMLCDLPKVSAAFSFLVESYLNDRRSLSPLWREGQENVVLHDIV